MRTRQKIFCSLAILSLVLFMFVMQHQPATQENEGLKEHKQLQQEVLAHDQQLLVLVMTGPDNFDRRQAARETWLRDGDVVHRFVIGTRDLEEQKFKVLLDEHLKYQDLMLLDELVDKYENLTMKLGMMLTQATKQYVHFTHLLKVDDDSFARLAPIQVELASRDPTHMLYWGYFYGRGRIKTQGPWHEPNWKLCDLYLPYARGGGYVLSRALVNYVAANWHLFERFLSEDVSLGTWVAPLRVERWHDIRFDTEYKTRGCSNTYLVSHKQSIEDIRAKQKSLDETGKLCVQEFTNFYGYEYDWSFPPSKCCIRHPNIP